MGKIRLKDGVYTNAGGLILAAAGALTGSAAEQLYYQYTGWAGLAFGLGILAWGVTVDGEHWWRRILRWGASKSPISVCEHLFCEATRVVDEDGEPWSDLEAVTIYLQVTNTKTDGTTIKGLRASLRNGYDKYDLPIRNGVSDLRHGEVELIELGTVVATPPPGTGFAPGVGKPPFAINKSEGEYLRRGGDHRSLRLAGQPKHRLGTGVPFYVVITAEDTVARVVHCESDLSQPKTEDWIRQGS